MEEMTENETGYLARFHIVADDLRDAEKSRNFTRFVKKLLLASMVLFLLALLVGFAI